MNFKEILKEAILNNTKIIVTGKSGWGKSEMIQQVAKDLGYELIDFRLSEVLPEDLVGLPKLRDDYYEYVPPKWLYDVVSNPDKKYLLFLDEITQGTPEVLNICYKIFDKVTKIGNYTLNNVAVVGATNYSDESNYLSELPQPLKNRACMIELDHNVNNAANYLLEKFNINQKASLRYYEALKRAIQDSNPRSVEKAVNLIKAGCSKKLVTPFVGFQSYNDLLSVFGDKENKAQNLSNLDVATKDLQRGYTLFNGTKYRNDDLVGLKLLYNLSDEEYGVLKKTEKPTQIPNDLNTNLVADVLASKPDVDASTMELVHNEARTFSPLYYITKMKINVKTMTNQFESLKAMLCMTDEELLRELVKRNRTLPIEVMRLYRDKLPWDLLKVWKQKGWLTANKINEFRKELS